MLDAQTGEIKSGIVKPESRRADGGNGSTHGAMGPSTDTPTYGDKGGASRFYYVAKAGTKERSAGLEERNTHPTVKPLALMRWLVRLVTPPDGWVLDPFMGSGTTGIAAALEGFRFVGLELEPEYVEMARQRIAHHRKVDSG
jgi:DNA modification methylase